MREIQASTSGVSKT